MTFYRKGHFRTSKLGKRSYVTSHMVDRSYWPSHQTSTSSYDPVLARFPEIGPWCSSTARYVAPNARCPVCHQAVFYYQNENGSRVFFDELGPPWPKHPCTDTGSPISSTGNHDGLFAPNVRSDEDASVISEWLAASKLNPTDRFQLRFKSDPWPLAVILKRIKSGASVFLILWSLEPANPKMLYASCKSLPRCIQEGSCIAIDRGRLSFFSTSAMEVKEVRAEQFRNASAFIKGLAHKA